MAEVLRAANQDLIYAEPRAPGGQFRVLNEIAYADDAGEMQFLRRTLLAGAFKFDTRSSQVPPTQLLDVFRGRLDAVGKLVCIGYGFRDLHINDIIRRWLETSTEWRLEVVNPGPNVVSANLLHLAPQVTLAPISASAWFDQYAGITRTPEEQVRKAVTMSMPDRGPDVRARILAWLEKRPGEGWFFANGDNYSFGTAADAAAFKQWLMSATIA